MKKIMVFGTFDGLHEGHRAFFKEAKSHGDYLIAVIAQDAIVERLKGKRPMFNQTARIEELQKEDGVDEVAVGDKELGTWEIVKRHRPEIIALGYDQDAMRRNLESRLQEFDWRPALITTSAFEPNKYKSSILNGE